jgi:hypothetical protein
MGTLLRKGSILKRRNWQTEKFAEKIKNKIKIFEKWDDILLLNEYFVDKYLKKVLKNYITSINLKKIRL